MNFWQPRQVLTLAPFPFVAPFSLRSLLGRKALHIDSGKTRGFCKNAWTAADASRFSPRSPTRQHAPGQDEWGYEDAGERWLPVHTVESIVSTPRACETWHRRAELAKQATDGDPHLPLSSRAQLVSVISLLSADVPDLNSPANVDAAKQVRGESEMPAEVASQMRDVLSCCRERMLNHSPRARLACRGLCGVQEKGSQACEAVGGGSV